MSDDLSAIGMEESLALKSVTYVSMLGRESSEALMRELLSGQSAHTRLTQKWETLQGVDVAAAFVSTAVKTTNMSSQRLTLKKTCRRDCH
jgi:hypothetical protein